MGLGVDDGAAALEDGAVAGEGAAEAVVVLLSTGVEADFMLGVEGGVGGRGEA
jgi:hypothetical protein